MFQGRTVSLDIPLCGPTKIFLSHLDLLKKSKSFTKLRTQDQLIILLGNNKHIMVAVLCIMEIVTETTYRHLMSILCEERNPYS